MNKRPHIFALSFLLIPILYVGIFGWAYRDIDESHCSDYNLRMTHDYDVEACQINGTNLVVTRDGSGAYLSLRFTYPQDIDQAMTDLAQTDDLFEEMEILESLYSFSDLYGSYEEGILRIGQYDLDEAIEVSVSSHPMMTYPGIHGSTVVQIDRYGVIHKEESVWTQLFMGYVTQFAAWWSYLGILLYVIFVGGAYLLKDSKD